MWQRVQVLKPLLRQVADLMSLWIWRMINQLAPKFIAHHSDRLESRKQWLFAAPSAGVLTIDQGAENAMLVQNKSLLPAGITAVEGRFSRGEVVKIKNTLGKVIALGMPRYNSDALELIKGKKSQDIEQILGYEYGAVALHRDDMDCAIACNRNRISHIF